MKAAFEVNCESVEVDVEPRLSLADCLRDVLGLTGTHLGCEHGVCGACTVIVDGRAVRSCSSAYSSRLRAGTRGRSPNRSISTHGSS